jgi:acyl dehydratase
MPLDAGCVGARLGPIEVDCDARSLMAYAAGAGQARSEYFDTTRAGGVVAHPLFPVAPEWELLTGRHGARPDYGLLPEEALRGVHASHDILLHRSIRQGDRVELGGQVAGVERTAKGGRLTLRFDATEGAGPVWTTWVQSLYRGVDVVGSDVPPDGAPLSPGTGEGRAVLDSRRIALGPADGHVYTECARIWNPIHTDAAVALAAGLPAIILHGTATLAHGVSATMEMLEAGPEAVRRVGGEFRAMVLPPTEIEVRLLNVAQDRSRRVAIFDVTSSEGGQAVRDGFVVLGTTADSAYQ